MKLEARVKSKYLDELLSGTKTAEFRQFEYLSLIDENNRIAFFKIVDIFKLNVDVDSLLRAKIYTDVPWKEELSIYEIDVELIKDKALSPEAEEKEG